ncbi:hypothetical protein FVR03_02755 [Pontibacter qinzhouensis]|uniref:Uncharacterized protein n=1 Tax=Pontibacter qinzhouensis TaxID=2603253 RepID=A0A5C8KCD6_9BACT|nr:hypothetical protein [Pontibacter qinzhouensis]TXK51871.1 hypothetical protein FVR03_02755 [Pontibacter qinzhouensis]
MKWSFQSNFFSKVPRVTSHLKPLLLLKCRSTLESEKHKNLLEGVFYLNNWIEVETRTKIKIAVILSDEANLQEREKAANLP